MIINLPSIVIIILYSIFILNFIANIFTTYEVNHFKNNKVYVFLSVNLVINLTLLFFFSYDHINSVIGEVKPLVSYEMSYFILLASLDLMLLIALIVLFFYYNKKKNNTLSLYSVKESIDKYPNAIFLFENGKMIIQNKEMERLSRILFGYVIYNGDKFWEMLIDFTNSDSDTDEIFVPILDKTYYFKKSMVSDDTTEIIAKDLTEEFSNIKLLESDKDDLVKAEDDLNLYLSNIETLQKIKQEDRIKHRVHNTLSYQINKLTRDMDSGNVDIDQLYEQINKLKFEFIDGTDDLILKDKIDSLNDDFKQIGVEIHVLTKYPSFNTYNSLLFDIIKEATTNAIFHGNANEINISFNEGEKLDVEITNNGKSETVFRMGGGLTSLKSRVLSEGGEIKIAPEDHFKINIIFNYK